MNDIGEKPVTPNAIDQANASNGGANLLGSSERSLAIDIYRVGAELQEWNRRPEGQVAKIADKLCISPSDVADVYLLSFVDEPNHLDDPKTANMIGGRDEIQYYLSKSPPDHDRAALLYNTYDYTRTIGQKHVLAATRTMLYEYLRWAPKDSEVGDLTQKLTDVFGLAQTKEPIEDLFKQASVGDVLDTLQNVFQRHNSNWQSVCKSTRRLYASIIASDESLSWKQIFTEMTLLHQQIHAGGGGVLELMLRPGEKDLGNELLIRFRSESRTLTDASMFEFGSPEAKKLFQRDRRQKEPYSLLTPEPIDNVQEQLLLAKSLLNNAVLSERIDRMAKSLSRYPLFKTVLDKVFGGDLRPDDDKMHLAKEYLQVAVDKQSIDSSVIIYSLVEKEHNQKILELAYDTSFFRSLSPEAQGIVADLAVDGLKSILPQERNNSLLFIEISEALKSARLPEQKRVELVDLLKSLVNTVEPDTAEYYSLNRVLSAYEELFSK